MLQTAPNISLRGESGIIFYVILKTVYDFYGANQPAMDHFQLATFEEKMVYRYTIINYIFHSSAKSFSMCTYSILGDKTANKTLSIDYESQQKYPLKGQCHDIFDPRFFSSKHHSWSLNKGLKPFRI
jgi:hypothetical protein